MRKKKKLISDSKESDISLFSVATLSSSDLQMKAKYVHSRKGNPEGRRKNYIHTSNCLYTSLSTDLD